MSERLRPEIFSVSELFICRCVRGCVRLSEFFHRSADFHERGIIAIAGGLLLFAAVSKAMGYENWGGTSSYASYSMPILVWIVVLLELGVVIVLLLKKPRWIKVTVLLGVFAVFAGVQAVKWLSGDTSCGCMGPSSVPMNAIFAIDVVLVVYFLIRLSSICIGRNVIGWRFPISVAILLGLIGAFVELSNVGIRDSRIIGSEQVSAAVLKEEVVGLLTSVNCLDDDSHVDLISFKPHCVKCYEVARSVLKDGAMLKDRDGSVLYCVSHSHVAFVSAVFPASERAVVFLDVRPRHFISQGLRLKKRGDRIEVRNADQSIELFLTKGS